MPERPVDPTAVSPSEPPEPGRKAPRPAEPLANAAAGADIATEVEAARRDPRRAFGPYLLLSELGRGGMGVVYRAWHDGTRRVVALKTILAEAASAENVQRFQREVEAFARLKHENIVSVHDAGTFQSTHYLVMEYVPGTTLDRRIRDHGARKGRSARGSLDLAKGVEIVRDVAQALHYAHTRGILHRDLKPQNILLDQDDRPHVLDFGLARVEDMKTLTKTGATMGTIAYMPPEQAGKMRETDARSDVYSLGATLYHVLTGHPPFEGPPVTAMAAVISQRPDPPSSVNPDAAGALDAICLKCLEKDPNKRYPTAAALALDLDAYLAGKPVAASSRRGVLIGAAALAALAVTLVALGIMNMGSREEPLPSPTRSPMASASAARTEATPSGTATPKALPPRVPTKRIPITPGEYFNRIARLSPARVVVSGGQLDKQKAVVISVEDPPRVVKILDLGESAHDSKRHRIVGVSSAQPWRVVAYDESTFEEAWTCPTDRFIPTSIDVDPEHDRLYVGSQGGGGSDPVWVLDAGSGKLLRETRIGGTLGHVHFDPAARKLYASRSNDLVILSPEGELEAEQVGYLPFAVDSVRGRALCWPEGGSRLGAVDGRTHATTEARVPFTGGRPGGFDPVEKRLYVPEGKEVMVIDTERLALADRFTPEGATGPCMLAEVDPASRRLYVVALPYEAPSLFVFSLSK